jgi:hypothetical protein
MATLIKAVLENGKTIRCDEGCYNATGLRSQCSCVCGGANHGVRLYRAVQNTVALAGDWKIAYQRRHGRIAQYEAVGQSRLF